MQFYLEQEHYRTEFVGLQGVTSEKKDKNTAAPEHTYLFGVFPWTSLLARGTGISFLLKGRSSFENFKGCCYTTFLELFERNENTDSLSD